MSYTISFLFLAKTDIWSVLDFAIYANQTYFLNMETLGHSLYATRVIYSPSDGRYMYRLVGSKTETFIQLTIGRLFECNVPIA